jgi:hypothetical protein
MKYLIESLWIALWIIGFVVSKGFWSTLFCIIPFWAWYLSFEYFFKAVTQ